MCALDGTAWKSARRRSALLFASLLMLLTACHSDEADDTGTTPAYTHDMAADESRAHFILVGDMQRTSFWERFCCREQNDAQRLQVMQRIAGEQPAFLVLLGDLVFQASNENQWEEFDLLMHDVRGSAVPVFPVLGNHEYYGNNRKARQHLNSRFPVLRKNDWYDLRYKGIALLVVNGNTEEMDKASLEEQSAWYRRRLVECDEDSAVTHVFVCCHQPPYTNSTLQSDDAIRELFADPFRNSTKGAVFFSGHVHAYEHILMQGKHFIVSGGGGGPRRAVDTSQQRMYADVYEGGEIRPFHYMRVDVEQTEVRITMQQWDESSGSWSVGDEILLRR